MTREYTRTLFLILCKAFHDLYPNGRIQIQCPVSNGYYCDLQMSPQPIKKGDSRSEDISPDIVADIRHRMQQIITDDLPIEIHKGTKAELLEVFKDDLSKTRLIESLDFDVLHYVSLDGYCDKFYSKLLPSTGAVKLFGLEMYYDGMLLRVPDKNDPTKLGKFIKQNKMFDTFMFFHKWQEMMDVSNIGSLNKANELGYGTGLIIVNEALQDKRLGSIADDIKRRQGVRVVLIAGPSSSGKTTTCKRLGVQLYVNGLNPVGISLDDYYIDREKTPRDETGDYDFESLYALDLDLFNSQLNALIAGEEVELPRYNFKAGKSEKSGKKIRLDKNDILVIEGIHALNPELTSQIPESQIYRVYASALTSLMLDDHNYIPTTDNRLLRRMVRDYKYRGTSAQETIRRWASVRRGEDKWIFPYQENANAVFNTALIFELAVLKTQAWELLNMVPEDSPEYAEAHRLRQFLRHVKAMPEDKIPPTSLLREFLGGSSFEY